MKNMIKYSILLLSLTSAFILNSESRESADVEEEIIVTEKPFTERCAQKELIIESDLDEKDNLKDNSNLFKELYELNKLHEKSSLKWMELARKSANSKFSILEKMHKEFFAVFKEDIESLEKIYRDTKDENTKREIEHMIKRSLKDCERIHKNVFKMFQNRYRKIEFERDHIIKEFQKAYRSIKK